MAVNDRVFTKYREIADSFISSDFGINCKIFYPSKRIDCPNCVFDANSGKSSNRYQTGGPVPFTFGVCPYCQGQGYRLDDSRVADTIKLRCYFKYKDWIKIRNIVEPDGLVQIIGFIYDLPKLKNCSYVLLNSDQSDYQELKYVPDGDFLPHGFKKDRYFIGFLKRGSV